jgi:hypothetical protein
LWFYSIHIEHLKDIVRKIRNRKTSKFAIRPFVRALRGIKSSTSIEKFRSGKGGTQKYAKKYAAKTLQKVIPESVKSFGRFWGIRGVRTVEATTVELGDDVRFNKEKRQKLNELSEIVEKGIQNEKIREYAVLLPDKNGERTKDIGVTVWTIRDAPTIRQITHLINQISGETIENRGWYADKVPICPEQDEKT